MYNTYNILEWDSQFFGYKIAAIQAMNLRLNELNRIIVYLKEQSFKLVYCFINPDDEISETSIKNSSGRLVDKKITFYYRISEANNYISSPFIAPYSLNYVSEKLKLLALQSGIYSRFRTDPNFHSNEYEKLYLEWIEKSVKRKIAEQILVYVEDEDEKGFITLAVKGNIGSIGLIAVDENERGKSIGKKLIQSALQFFKNKNVEIVEVVTQTENKVACGFYKSLGFEVKSVVNIYHLWIN